MAITVVVGLGSSGISAARLLKKEGKDVMVLEERQTSEISEKAEKLQKEGIRVELGRPLDQKIFEHIKKELKEIVISPGVSWNHPALLSLRKKKVPIKGEMAIAWERLKEFPWVGITGTNGKTTVTNLLSHVLERNGIHAPMGGNIGESATKIALELKAGIRNKPDWLIMELSSYQIEASQQISPQIGIWTNLSPDHLERHGSIEAYRSIKRGLLERSDIRIFNADDPDLNNHRKTLSGGIWISAEGKGSKLQPNHLWINPQGFIENAHGTLFIASALPLYGKHNSQNLLLVTAAALQIGVKAQGIEHSLASFQGVAHRMEFLGEFNTLKVFNDSKATNYHAAIKGIEAVESPTIIIAGGQIKQGDPTEWLNKLNQRASTVILFGESRKDLWQKIKDNGFTGNLFCCENLKEAVKVSFKYKKEGEPNSLLLSPACASFDQYPNFEARGEHFRHLIKAQYTTS